MRKPLPPSRICKICGVEYKPTTPVHSCRACINELARIKNKEKMQERMQSGEWIPYEEMRPEEMRGSKDEMAKKYRKLTNQILLMSREEYRDYLKRKLDEIMNNGPLWRYLTREGLGETLPKKDVVKEPKLSKREKWIQSGNTRNLSWDEWERMGFGLDEDK